MKTLEGSCPLRTSNAGKRTAWWTCQLTTIKTRLDKLVNRSESTRQVEDCTAYKNDLKLSVASGRRWAASWLPAKQLGEEPGRMKRCCSFAGRARSDDTD